MAKQPIDSFEIAQAANLSGLTVSMVDYLCREQVLIPTMRWRRGRGRPRRYSFGDVVMLRVLGRLLDAGVSVRRIKQALQTLRRYHKDITRTSLPRQYFVTDGRKVYLRDKDTLLDLDGTAQMSFLFVLELRQVQDEVLRAIGRG
jgi:DNA-binding transcriptional MerR regulator